MEIPRLLDGRLRFRHLVLIDALSRHGSVVGAAAELHVTQPAATRSPHELEDILGVPLFERGPRGVTPTVFGEAFTRHARAVLAQLTQAGRRAVKPADADRGTVVGGTHPLTGREGVEPGELVDHLWMLPGAQTALRRESEELFGRHGFALPLNRVETTSFLTIRQLLLETYVVGGGAQLDRPGPTTAWCGCRSRSPRPTGPGVGHVCDPAVRVGGSQRGDVGRKAAAHERRRNPRLLRLAMPMTQRAIDAFLAVTGIAVRPTST
ncbi:LysR family transcriptional regulator [Streptomyces sp. NPDC001599]|uniref:LysR family transcriptional regulator n=1 Tax=Streptomyces sp. NPDC001599 TaxID=3364591 RepID=UPI0036C23E35